MKAITFAKMIRAPFVSIPFLFFCLTSYSQTSWKGVTSTAWNTASNWSNGVPTSSVDAIIGDANFTGPNQPTITNNSTCNHLQLGEQ